MGMDEGKALRSRLQSFAWAGAKLCVDGCKALRGRLQSFALAVAKLCVGRCNALREIGKVGTQKSLVLFWIR